MHAGVNEVPGVGTNESQNLSIHQCQTGVTDQFLRVKQCWKIIWPLQMKLKQCPRVKSNDVRFMVTSTTISCVPTIALHPRIRFRRIKTSSNVGPIGHRPRHIGCEGRDGDITASMTVWAGNLSLGKKFSARVWKVANCNAQRTKRIFWSISRDLVQISGSRDCKLVSGKGIVMKVVRLHVPSFADGVRSSLFNVYCNHRPAPVGFSQHPVCHDQEAHSGIHSSEELFPERN